LLPLREETLVEVLEIVRSVPSALMCKEAEPNCCHRTTLARELSSRSGLPVIDVTPKSSTQEAQPALL
jgi:uncharacterized protein (DUF488 family)